MTPVLTLDSVSAGYGPFNAIFDISLSVNPGEAVALLGANGMGKTSVARVASGLIFPTSGKLLVEGTELTGSRPHRFVQAGIAHAVEGRSVFASLTVEENLRLSFHRAFGRSGVNMAVEKALSEFPALERRRDQLAGKLSGGEQRMLSLARVLVEAPKLLIADELSLGLAPVIVGKIYEHLAQLRDDGTALLIVEQQVGHALKLCSRAIILEHGRVVWQGPSEEAAERVAIRFSNT